MNVHLRLYAGTQSGMLILRGVGDIWTSMGGSREFQPYFKDQVVDSVYGCRTSPEVVYVGVTSDGLYRTKDEGKHGTSILEDERIGACVDNSIVWWINRNSADVASTAAKMVEIPGSNSRASSHCRKK